jgi:hypothetical protein
MQAAGTVTVAQRERLWIFGVLPAVLLNLIAVVLFGGYGTVRAAPKSRGQTA